MHAPTEEQQRALDLFAFGDSLAIEAGAGTGKTTTLSLLGRASRRRGQYVAFNKAIVTDAARTMPRHVACATAHGLAYRAVGREYQHRLRSERVKSSVLARHLGIDPFVVKYGSQRKVLDAGYLAGHVMQGVARFCASADLEPERRHFPYIDGIDPPEPSGRRTWAANDEVADHLDGMLEVAWRDLRDPDGRLPYGHEHYLKAWQLSDPKIAADYVLFDEAQDASPVMLAVVGAQEHAQLVFVGDSQQAIYEFTGAVNALATVPAEQRAYLTQSFRFGPEIAAVANLVLGQIRGAELQLEGSPHVASVVGPIAEPDVLLTRTNAAAMQAMLDELAAGRAPHLVGGGGDVLRFARAAWSLMQGQRTSYRELACFETWAEVVEYVEHDPAGGELKMLVSLMEEHGPGVIAEALDRTVDEEHADLVISTAHKAKGREWDAVTLGSDFPDGDEAPTGRLSSAELRLIYVACTRARRELDPFSVPMFAGSDPML